LQQKKSHNGCVGNLKGKKRHLQGDSSSETERNTNIRAKIGQTLQQKKRRQWSRSSWRGCRYVCQGDRKKHTNSTKQVKKSPSSQRKPPLGGRKPMRRGPKTPGTHFAKGDWHRNSISSQQKVRGGAERKKHGLVNRGRQTNFCLNNLP